MLSPLTLWVRIVFRRGAHDKTLCFKVCHWLATGLRFFPGTQVSSINKTYRHDITEILLKMALVRHHKQTDSSYYTILLPASNNSFCIYLFLFRFSSLSVILMKSNSHSKKVALLNGHHNDGLWQPAIPKSAWRVHAAWHANNPPNGYPIIPVFFWPGNILFCVISSAFGKTVFNRKSNTLSPSPSMRTDCPQLSLKILKGV